MKRSDFHRLNELSRNESVFMRLVEQAAIQSALVREGLLPRPKGYRTVEELNRPGEFPVEWTLDRYADFPAAEMERKR